MKKAHKYSLASLMMLVMSVLTISFTYAQRGGHGGGGGGSRGGGGGFHGGGGGGGFHGAPQGNRGGGVAPRSAATPHFNGGNGGRSFAGTPGRAPAPIRAYRSPAGGYNRPYYAGRGGIEHIGRGYYGYGHPVFAGAYYNRFYAPRLGFRINILPYGYYPFYYGPDQYFYNNGFFYQQYGANDYEVVAPPIGAEVNSVPAGAQSIMIDGVQYYELNGVYYQPVTEDDGSVKYQIAGKDGQLQTNPGPDQNQQYNNQPQGNNTNPGN